MADPADTAAELVALGAATLGESGGQPMSRRIAAAWGGARLAATAFTVQCTRGDNLAIHVAVARAAAGDALVVDTGLDPDHGYWGEVLTTGAEARGVAGLVIDGGVRDVAALAAHGFPVFSAGIALAGATKDRAGALGEPVAVGDVVVETGDWIVGDADGVVAIAAGALGDVLEAGRAREEKERKLFEELRSGRTTLELLDLDPGPVD
jgi:4-hydroxy-4-methyl-2-oxoglutarate aldolase